MTDQAKPSTHSPAVTPATAEQTARLARNAFRVVALVFATTVLLAAISFYRYLQNPSPTLGLAVIFVATLVQGFNLWLCRRGQSSLAIGIMLATIWFVFFNNQFASSGTGLVLAVSGISITILVAAQTMPAKPAGRTITAGVVLGIGVLLLDLFGPERPPTQTLASILTIGGAFIIANLIFVARQFSTFSLRNKLMVGVIALTAASVGSLAALNNYTSQANLTANVGAGLKSIAISKAAAIGSVMDHEAEILTSFALSEVVQDRVQAVNATYGDEQTAIESQLLQLDQIWRAADAAGNNDAPIVQTVLNENIASELREFNEAFPHHAEVFVTDRYGAIVAATNRTSDYYQADEEWWQAAYANGQGALYIGQPALDESSQTFGVILALPLYGHGTREVVGVLRSTLSLEIVFDILEAEILGGHGHADMFLPGGQVLTIENRSELETAEPDSLLLVNELLTQTDYKSFNYEGDQSVVSAAAVEPEDLEEGAAIQALGWTVVAHQAETISLAPVREQTRTTLLFALVILGVSVAAAAFVAGQLAGPIQRLTQTAEKVSAGDLTAQAQVETNDEIGQLAKTFNTMTAQVRETVVGLEERVAERTRAVALSAEVSRRLSGLLDQKQLISEVVEQVRSTFNYYHTHIYLFDAKRDYLVMAGGTGDAAATMMARQHRLEAGRGLVGRAAQENMPVLVADVAEDPNWLANPLLPDTKAELAVPIAVGAQVLGVLDVQQNQVNGLDEADAQILGSIANQVGIALQNAQSYEQTQRQVERETFLNTINQKIQRAATIEDILQIATRELGQALGAERAVAQLNNPNKNGSPAAVKSI